MAYHCGRGEKLTPAKRYASEDAYLRNVISDMGVSFAYFFDGGKWHFRPASKYKWFELCVKM